MRSDLISLINCPSNRTLSSEVIRLLRITAFCVIFYDATVIKVIFKLTCYQWHSLIFTHVLCILRIGFCPISKLPYDSFCTLVSVGKTRVKAPTSLWRSQCNWGSLGNDSSHHQVVTESFVQLTMCRYLMSFVMPCCFQGRLMGMENLTWIPRGTHDHIQQKLRAGRIFASSSCSTQYPNLGK